MKILLLGRDGQLGRELRRSLAGAGEVVALGRRPEGGLCGDLAEVDALCASIRSLRPDVIVNAAAWTAVDAAEQARARVFAVNAEGPAVLAAEAAALGAWLVHYSTDYVFGGSGERPRAESDEPAPCNVYGESKLAGERAIQASGCRHLIFRTSWLHSPHGGNFARTLLRLACERDSLSVVADQIGAPTAAALVADVTVTALRAARQQPELGGLYHLAAAGETSWHGYAVFLLTLAEQAGWPLRVRADQVVAVPARDYPAVARRPSDSRLDTRRLAHALGITLPPWQDGVRQLMGMLTPPA